MVSKKTVLSWVFSGVVGLGMFAIPGAALAQGPNGWNHPRAEARHEHRAEVRQDRREVRQDRHELRQDRRFDHPAARYQQPQRYGWNTQPAYRYNNPSYRYNNPSYGYNNPAYRYNQPAYGLNQGYNYNQNGAVNGMANPRNPNLVWTCDSDGHHCHWAERFGANNYNNRYAQPGLNPFAFGSGTNGYGNGYNANGSGYYGNNPNYANGYYGNSPMGGLGSMLGPLFGGQQR